MSSYKFTPRFTPPTQSNATDRKYWFSANNGYYTSGYGMPNCTAYALGRINELLALNNMSYPDFTGYLGNAETWGNSGVIGNNWTHTQQPKLGCIAVFKHRNSSGGHVAVVEEINQDGTVTLSNSGWAGRQNVGNENHSYWFWVNRNVDIYHHKNYEFRYYLYPPYITDEPEPPEPPEPPKPTKKKSWIPLALVDVLKYNL